MRWKTASLWLDALIGALFLGLGIILLRTPEMALGWLVTLLGVAAILSGISDIRARRSTLSGIAGILAGLLLVLYPVIGQGMLSIVLPLWFITRCVLRILGFDLFKQSTGRAPAILMLCLNMAALLFGVIMLFNATLFTLSLGLLVAVELIILGISNLVEAFGRVAPQGYYRGKKA